jgi:hypothetical protein
MIGVEGHGKFGPYKDYLGPGCKVHKDHGAYFIHNAAYLYPEDEDCEVYLDFHEAQGIERKRVANVPRRKDAVEWIDNYLKDYRPKKDSIPKGYVMIDEASYMNLEAYEKFKEMYSRKSMSAGDLLIGDVPDFSCGNGVEKKPEPPYVLGNWSTDMAKLFHYATNYDKQLYFNVRFITDGNIALIRTRQLRFSIGSEGKLWAQAPHPTKDCIDSWSISAWAALELPEGV